MWGGLDLKISGDLPTPWARREEETFSCLEEDEGEIISGDNVEGSHQWQRGWCELCREGVPQSASVASPFLGFTGMCDISEQESQRRGHVGSEMVILTPC